MLGEPSAHGLPVRGPGGCFAKSLPLGPLPLCPHASPEARDADHLESDRFGPKHCSNRDF